MAVMNVHPCTLLNDKFLLSTATEGRRIEQKRCLPLQTRKPIYNMDVVNWCNLLLLNTTDILVRSELTSVSKFAREFFLQSKKTSLLLRTNGIRAAFENPRRIKTAKDGSGFKQNRVRTANSQTKNVHGCSFFVVPAGVFCALLTSVPSISKG